MNLLTHTLAAASLFAVASSSSAAVINVYTNADGTGMAPESNSGLVLTVGDSPVTPGAGQELIVTGDPTNDFNGRIRHASLNGTGQGLLTVPAGATTFELTYEIFLPASGKNFKRDVPKVRFFENFNAFSSPNQEFTGFGNGANQSTTGVYQTVSYTGTVPTGFAANYVQLEIWLEQSGNAGEDGDVSTFIRNVELNVTAVPEPASLALLSLGGVCLLGRRRSRR